MAIRHRGESGPRLGRAQAAHREGTPEGACDVGPVRLVATHVEVARRDVELAVAVVLHGGAAAHVGAEIVTGGGGGQVDSVEDVGADGVAVDLGRPSATAAHISEHEDAEALVALGAIAHHVLGDDVRGRRRPAGHLDAVAQIGEHAVATHVIAGPVDVDAVTAVAGGEIPDVGALHLVAVARDLDAVAAVIDDPGALDGVAVADDENAYARVVGVGPDFDRVVVARHPDAGGGVGGAPAVDVATIAVDAPPWATGTDHGEAHHEKARSRRRRADVEDRHAILRRRIDQLHATPDQAEGFGVHVVD